MILPAIGLIIGAVFFGVVGLVVLSRRERLTGPSLTLFVVFGFLSAAALGLFLRLLSEVIFPNHDDVFVVPGLLLMPTVPCFIAAYIVEQVQQRFDV